MAQYTVVIVEDNATSADIIARQMEAVGFQERHIVGTAQEGLALAQQLQPDLMVIDERLPDASGTDLLRTVKEQQPGITLIMCTVVDDEGMMQAAFAAGCNYYAVKPNG